MIGTVFWIFTLLFYSSALCRPARIRNDTYYRASRNDTYDRASPTPMSSVVVFGASYCDSSHAQKGYPYTSGRVTNGLVWPEYLAHQLDAQLHDYAYAGAKASPGSVPDTAQQMEKYISDLKSGNTHLGSGRVVHLVWVGINSINQIWQAGEGEAALEAEVERVHQQLNWLSNQPDLNKQMIFAEFVILTIPPLELIPNSVQFASRSKNPLGALDRVKALTSVYNRGLMKLQSDKIRVFDIVPFWSGIASNPKEYGFAHVKKACLGGGIVCHNPVAYMYWDSLHPTTKMHEIIAKQVHEYLGKIV